MTRHSTTPPWRTTIKRPDKRFWRHHALLPALLFIGFNLLAHVTSLDVTLADRFYDFGQQRWTHGESAWANAIIHELGRKAIALVFLLSGATGLLSLLPGLARLRPYRRGAFYLALCILLTTGLVGLGKATTNVDCPWDLQRYGGPHPFVHLFSDRPDGLPRGRCFPGGHSSGGFSLLALYFLWRRYRPELRWLGLFAGGAIGLLFSLGQWARGAHFPSHDLWSAAIAWSIALLIGRLMLARR